MRRPPGFWNLYGEASKEAKRKHQDDMMAYFYGSQWNADMLLDPSNAPLKAWTQAWTGWRRPRTSTSCWSWPRATSCRLVDQRAGCGSPGLPSPRLEMESLAGPLHDAAGRLAQDRPGRHIPRETTRSALPRDPYLRGA